MKYEKTTIIEIAQKRGSKAKTHDGAWKFLLANLPRPAKPRHSQKWQWDDYRQARHNRTADGRARSLGYDPNDPNTPGRIMDRAIEDNREWDRRRSIDIVRDNYGALCQRYGEPPLPRPETFYWDALDLLAEAVKQKIIPYSYDSIRFDHKGRADGSAQHHEIYDYAKNAVLVCIRETEGNRYGVKTTSKTYTLIMREGDTITTAPTTEPIAKLAKTGAAPGSIIARVLGAPNGAKLPAPATMLNWETAYKALAKVDEKLCSIYSGEEYQLGNLKRERAQRGHAGGYYCYSTIDAAQHCEVPDDSKYYSAPRVIVKCEVAGNKVVYNNGKICRTYLRPVEIVAQ